MKTGAIQQTRHTTEPAVVLSLAGAPAARCGDCAFHMTHATTPDGWCAKAEAKLRWQSVSPQREACDCFAEAPDLPH